MSEACRFQGLFLAFCVCTDMRPSLIVLFMGHSFSEKAFQKDV